MKKQIKIETNRITLVPISMEYLEDIFEFFTPEITVYMTPKIPSNIAETKNFIEESTVKNNQKTDLQLVVLNKAGEFLGCAGLHKINTKQPELGIWIKKPAHGHGFGIEAMQILKSWADNNIDYEYIKYPVDKRNLASRRIPESMGGQVADTYLQPRASGGSIDCVEYRIYKIRSS